MACGELQFYANRSDVITNPQVIFEVPSRRTEGLDKGEKLDGYFSIPSFREYILVDQYRSRVSHYTRAENGDILRHDLLDEPLVLKRYLLTCRWLKYTLEFIFRPK